MNEDLKKELIETEEKLLSLYAQLSGLGGSHFIQYKQFLLRTRGSDGRVIVARFRVDAATVPGKEQGTKPGSQTPVPQTPQRLEPVPIEPVPNNPTPQVPQPGEQPQSDGAGVADINPFDVLKDDIEKMSLTAVASKYEKAELVAYAQSIGVVINDKMNEKQIVKAIQKANESKG